MQDDISRKESKNSAFRANNQFFTPNIWYRILCLPLSANQVKQNQNKNTRECQLDVAAYTSAWATSVADSRWVDITRRWKQTPSVNDPK